MDIRNVFSSRYLIPDDRRHYFKRKEKLNDIELIGLEAILAAFIHQYEEEEFGEVYSKKIIDFTHWEEDCVYILDGVGNTYVFENYAIGSVWMTENGIPMLSCYLLESDEYDDPFDIVENTDWISDCDHVLFSLF